MALVANNNKEYHIWHISLCDTFHYDMMLLEVLIDVETVSSCS